MADKKSDGLCDDYQVRLDNARDDRRTMTIDETTNTYTALVSEGTRYYPGGIYFPIAGLKIDSQMLEKALNVRYI